MMSDNDAVDQAMNLSQSAGTAQSTSNVYESVC